ncbi:unnamed protein product [Darwinula stevensoni]|uniref:Protein kinase domain-containing protein n=1 Tax=Darwinula stevensoni TaxID=69355 RepID=A0A7R9AFY2_9CRUS|nr:unnamed protein product [Darwinula stevensoni]CAG0902847.1 unnamed protein product [Darwinula stevensoni]
MMIVEYCPFGSLDKYLRANKDYFICQKDPYVNKIYDNIGKQVLLTEDSRSNDTAMEAKKDGTLGNEPVLKDVVAATLVTGSGGTNSGLQVDSAVSDTRIPASPNRRVNDWRNPLLAENALRKSSEGSILSRRFTTGNLVLWAYQIAQGMEYLGCRKVVHRDLAARNILLAEENIVKICDFGLARDIHRDNQYVMKGDGPLPIKWMALESLTGNMVSTSQSDVWAYGITLWEMFSLGMTPYPGISGQDLVQRLKDGYRLDAPQFANDHIYQIMKKCWVADPNNRPTFPTLSAWFGEMLQESERLHYLEMNKPYEERNVEYFRTKTDYLQMIPVETDDGYVRPLKCQDAYMEIYNSNFTYICEL